MGSSVLRILTLMSLSLSLSLSIDSGINICINAIYFDRSKNNIEVCLKGTIENWLLLSNVICHKIRYGNS